MIRLVEETIDKSDVQNLVGWLSQDPLPRLTQSDKVEEFEKAFSRWQNVNYSVFVNSGSSANLLMIYTLKALGKLKNKRIVVPAISWATTVAPVIQMEHQPVFCDADKNNLGVDVEHLKRLFETYHPSALVLVHVLGLPCDMENILELCREYDVTVLEDCCEALGTMYRGQKVGTLGKMSSFSFFFGHHMSTIEGGMVCTNDYELYNALRMMRNHGWDRGLDKSFQEQLRAKNNVDEFRALYTFYHPGFNLRGTDLQAFIGLEQMKKITISCHIRSENFKSYQELIQNDYWKPNVDPNDFISNFAYPVIHPASRKIVEALRESDVETRPLICGSMLKQPYIKNQEMIRHQKGMIEYAEFANEVVDEHGFYLPNHDKLKREDVERICTIVNGVIRP